MTYRDLVLAALFGAAGATAAHADVVISTAATQNMSCSGGTCTPTATKAILNANDLENDLRQFGNVQVMTTGSDVEANNIVVAAAFASPDSTSLTLDAHKAIAVNAAVSIGAGTAELELQSGKGGELGTLSFGPKGHITFGSLSDIFGINGGIFTLIGSVQGLASAAAANPAFALANSYDASQDGTYSGCPLSTLDGAVEGLGNTISNLSISVLPPNLAALVCSVGTTGIIENLRLAHIHYAVYGHRGITGAGGLASANDGSLVRDEVSGSIVSHFKPKHDSEYPFVGGIVNVNYADGAITASSTNVRISAAGGWGGGIASSNWGAISLSNANGSVSGAIVGGLVGYNYGTIDQSYAIGSVAGSYNAGGFAAYNQDDGGDPATISNSYATGEVSTSYYGSGGFVSGENGNEISSSYAIGAVSGGSGGFECNWYISNPVTDDYWNTTTSGTNNGICGGNVTGVTGLTTQQLQSGLPTGFDPKIWAEKPTINNGLPYLIANPPPK